jgi:UDP-sugar diphosphatase
MVVKNIIENFKLTPLEKANFVETALATYTQNGVEKSWEVVKSHDSVAILIYHKEKNAFILVKQFRPPVYRHDGIGMSTELCAGIIDKNLSIEQIAIEEIDEECGFKVSLENLTRITKVSSSVGTSGTSQTIFYAQVDESMRVGKGGGIDDEMIEVIELPISEAKTFMFDESQVKTTGLMFSFMWWFDCFDSV